MKRWCMHVWLMAVMVATVGAAEPERGRIAYLVSDLRIPFWEIMSRGLRSEAKSLGYEVTVLSAENSAKRELENTVRAIRERVEGIVVSPTSSSACSTILKLAEQAGIPVVISDIGTDEGRYVSYISSDNFDGAYRIGKVLAGAMHERGWQEGTVGIISIPQKRANGKARTAGFMKAMKEAGIESSGLRQQVTFSYRETYDYAMQLIAADPKLRALWLQGSDRYRGALDAIADAGKRGEILLICFDAEPEFLQMIPQGVLVGAAMQQPFLMGEKAVQSLHAHLSGERVPKQQSLPVLAVSTDTIAQNLPIIRRNVLGLEAE